MKKQILMISTIGMLMVACFSASPVIGSGYSSTSSGNILYVGGSGPGNYSKIQYAIGNTSDGDTIFVYNGTYYENVYIYKQIQLIGENRNNTIINASGDTYCILIAPDTPGVTVESFTLEYSGLKGLWIANHSDWAMVSDCIIRDNPDGIFIQNVLNVTIKNCAIVGNTNGLWQIDSNGSKIDHCYFADNYYCNIYLKGSSYNNISNCRITGIGPHEAPPVTTGIHLMSHSYENEIYNCRISGIDDSINFYDDASSNTVRECNIIDGNYEGIAISESNLNEILDTTISNCSIGVGLRSDVEHDSEKNSFNNCVISENKEYGILFPGSKCKNNKVIHCKFINNTGYQAWDSGSNIWDDGYPSGGNSWSDYTGIDRYNGPDQNINGSDGIGDTSYTIPSGASNVDHYPLVPLDEEAPQVEIVKPISGLYMNDKLVRKYFLPRIPLIIGTITIGFNASDNDSGVYRVEIFIDDESRTNITSEPYNFTWSRDKISLFKHKHTIKVVAYDYAGNSASDEITVRKFL